MREKRVNELMLQQDGRVLFYISELLSAGKMVLILRKVTNLWIRSIVPSDSSALTCRVNGIIMNENCDQKYTGLVW
jgi:hypothetical protein